MVLSYLVLKGLTVPLNASEMQFTSVEKCVDGSLNRVEGAWYVALIWASDMSVVSKGLCYVALIWASDMSVVSKCKSDQMQNSMRRW